MNGATCLDCGRLSLAAASGRPLCAKCEADDDAFRARMAERLNPNLAEEKAEWVRNLWGAPPHGGFTRR